ncbi:MAG TPA: hypothetical protein VFV50_15280, partial [Bdellovibrionales bacterium]|nr:hypothetical protein [Bdellovibrionales bacterium]
RELLLVEAKLWKSVLSAGNSKEADIYKLYEARFKSLPRDRAGFRGLFRGGDGRPNIGVDSTQLCKRLVELSQESLKDLPVASARH